MLGVCAVIITISITVAIIAIKYPNSFSSLSASEPVIPTPAPTPVPIIPASVPEDVVEPIIPESVPEDLVEPIIPESVPEDLVEPIIPESVPEDLVEPVVEPVIVIESVIEPVVPVVDIDQETDKMNKKIIKNVFAAVALSADYLIPDHSEETRCATSKGINILKYAMYNVVCPNERKEKNKKELLMANKFSKTLVTKCLDKMDDDVANIAIIPYGIVYEAIKEAINEGVTIDNVKANMNQMCEEFPHMIPHFLDFANGLIK
jgi:hypothetical protein